MIVRFISITSLLSLSGIAVLLILGKETYADYLGILTFCLYALLVIGNVIHWLFKKEK